MRLFLSACKDAFLNLWEGRSASDLRDARRASVMAASPIPATAARPLWPATERIDVESPDPAMRFPHTEAPHVGIANSLRCAGDVVCLHVTAMEARHYVDACDSLDAGLESLKSNFANLKVLAIEDDFLTDREMARISAVLPPVQLEWRQGLCVAGRYGR